MIPYFPSWMGKVGAAFSGTVFAVFNCSRTFAMAASS